MMTLQTVIPLSSQSDLDMQSGPFWTSFEQFRTSGQAGLLPIASGVVGTLITKSGQYRILAEDDFQRLYGLARETRRIQSGLRLVMTAAQAVRRHPEDATISTLVQAVSLVGDSPVLPTVERFEPLLPEGTEVDPDDEVILDPAALEGSLSP
ncbi:gll3656 [Gloeobacter violaceus PCC 7421]|uniref:Gll3656 protein n=2 Tax=Gloeobacter violaceus TaxID=33072 RepID=Q7NF70_GLOVI|nr:gll3656 [Gloeobacter violaceus PCC 7421]